MKNIIFVCILSCILGVPLFSGIHLSTVAEAKFSMSEEELFVQETLNQLLAVLESEDIPKEERYENISKILDPKFDFREMSKRSLGVEWSKLKKEQRNRFADVFGTLLENTYISKIELMTRDTVAVTGASKFPDTAKGVKRASVKTIVNYKGDKFPIEYKMYRKPDAPWKVYDVVIENVGLVNNFRTEFGSIMKKKGFDGLMEQLNKKVKS